MKQKFFLGILLTSCLAFTPYAANSAVTWDNDPATAGIQEGAGAWDSLGNYNWWNGGANVQWNNAAPDIAQFGDVFATSGNTVTVDAGGVTAAGLIFHRGYTLQGGPITLSGTVPVISIPDGAITATKAIMLSNITVTDGDSGTADDLVFQGAYATPSTSYVAVDLGSAAVSPTNTYSGKLKIQGGMLVSLFGPSTLSGASTGTVVEGGSALRILKAGTYGADQTLEVSGFGFGVGNAVSDSRAAFMIAVSDASVTWAGNLNLVSDATIAPSGFAGGHTISGLIYGPGKLVKTSTTPLILTNSNTFTGNTEIRRGGLDLNSSAGPAINKIGGNLVFRSDLSSTAAVVNIRQNEQIGDAAEIQFLYTGTTAGFQTINLLGNTETVRGLSKSTTSATSARIQNEAAGLAGKLILDAAGYDYSYNGTIQDGSAADKGTLSLVKKGMGSQTLDGPNAFLFTGDLTVEDGALILGNGTATTLGPKTIDVRSGTLDATYRTEQLLTIANAQTLKGGGTVNGNVALNSGANVAPGSSVGKLTINGNLTMTTPTSNMTWELGALKDDMTGVAGVDFDQLLINGTFGLGTSSNLTLDFGQLAANLRPDASIPSFFWSSNHSWKIVDNSYYTPTENFLSLTNASYDIGAFSTQIVSGGIQLDFLAHIAQTLIWRGNVNGNWDVYGTKNWTGGDGFFHNNDDVTFTDSGVTKNVVLTGTLNPRSITVNNSTGNDYTFGGSGDLMGNSGIAKSGEGKLTVANTGNFALSGDVALTAGTLVFNRGDAVLAGKLTGSGSLRQEGTGVLLLGGDNSGFTGAITVTGGTVKAGSDTAFGDAAVGMAVNAGGTVDLGGHVLGDKRLTLGGALVNSGSNLSGAVNNLILAGDVTFGGSGAWRIVDRAVATSGQFKLTKIGAGDMTLDGVAFTDPNHLGDIDVQGGTLWIANTTPIGDPTKTITVSDGGAIGFWWNSAPLEKNLTVAASGGAIFATGGPTLVFMRPVTMDGSLTVNVLNSSGTTYDFLTLSGNLSGAGGLTKVGGGTLTLQGNNTYAGPTTVSRGFMILDAASGHAVPGDLAINGDGDAIVKLKRSNQLPSTAAVNFANTSNGYSQLVLLGNNQTVSAISSDGGRAVIENVQSESGIVNNGVLTIDNAADCTYNGIIRNREGGSSTGKLALVKRGDGRLTIQGTGSGGYTGGLTVEAGVLDYGQGALPNCDYAVAGGTLDIGMGTATIGKLTITDGKLYSPYAYGMLTGTSTFDARGGDVSAVLMGAVGLTKTGAGTTKLTATNMYSGPTLIQEGALSLAYNPETYTAGSINSSSLIQISAGAFLDVSDPLAPAPFTVAVNQTLQGLGTVQGNVVLSSMNANSVLGAGNIVTGGALTITQGLTTDADAKISLHLSPNATGTNNDRIAVNGTLTLPVYGQTKIEIHAFGGTLDTTPGFAYTLLNYGSVSGGTLGSNLALVNNTRYTATLNLATPGQVKASFSGTGPINLVWDGTNASSPGIWDVKSTANWNGNTQHFYEMDNVLFDGTSTNKSVSLQDPYGMPVTVFPASITVNSSEAYSFYGYGKIGGSTGIVKQNTGTLTIGTANEFTGTVSITDGTVVVANANALGTADGGVVVSGTGALDVGGYELPLGEMVVISGAGFGGKGAVVNSVSSTVSVNNVKTLVLADNATIGGSEPWKVGGNPGGMIGGGNVLTKVGVNTVTLDNLGDAGLGGLVIKEGRLELAGDTTLGAATVTIDNLNTETGGVAELSFNGATASHANNLVVGSNGGTIVAKNGTASFLGEAGLLNGILNGKVSGGDNLILGHQITGAGGFSVNKDYVTTGTVTLTGSSNFTGGAHVYNGSLVLDCATGTALSGDVTIYGSANAKYLRLAADGQLDSSNVVHFNFGAGGGTMYFYLQGNDVTLGGIDLSYAYSDSQAVIANTASDGSNSVLTIDNTEDFKYRAVIRDTSGGLSGTPGSNTLALVKKGSGSLTIGGSKSGQYTGGLTVEAGTLNYVGGLFPATNGGPADTVVNGVLPGGNYTVTGGTLNIGTLSATIRALRIAGGLIDADAAAPGTLISDADFDIQGGTVEANLAGTTAAVGLTKTGARTANLEGSLLYTGNTTVWEGTLNVLDINTPAATVAVVAGGTLTASSVVADTLTIGGTPMMAAANSASAVPEPGTLTLLILAGLSLVAVCLRRG